MKIKKMYKYNSGRQIFRLLPTETEKLIVEERDRNLKEAYFSCCDINSGKFIFSDLQFDEKYWIGIKKIYKDVIFFHRFERPDFPIHKSVIAFDINSQIILWENKNNNFVSVFDDKVLLKSNQFGIEKIFLVNYRTGEIETDKINLTHISEVKDDFSNYYYPEKISQTEFYNSTPADFRKKIIKYLIKDYVNFAVKGDILFYNFHYIVGSKYNNIFFAIDKNGKIIFKELLNKKTDKIEPESFFIKDDLLFLLVGNSGFKVYKFI